MLLPLACLPLVAVLINDVRSESSPGTITVDVATSEPVARADVRGAPGGSRHMFVYLQGTTANRKSFDSESQPVVVHPRARYTKLEIPTDTRCGEPFSVETLPSGVRVRATCRDIGAPAGMAVPPVPVHIDGHAERPLPDAPLAARAHSRAQNDSLRAALALPAEATGAEGTAEAVTVDDSGRAIVQPDKSDKSDKTAPAGATAPAGPAKAETHEANAQEANSAKPVIAAPTVAPVKTMAPDAPVAALASVDSPDPAAPGRTGGDGKSSSNIASTLLAGFLLAGLGVAATLLARRRATRVRMIRIVETASIGPRRSLVVASIGGRTMVLGVSEAGVALLDTQAGPTVPPRAPEKTAPLPEKTAYDTLEEALGLPGLGQGRSEAPSDATEDAKHEGSLLSRLFHRMPSPEETRRAHEFDDLLSESLEDQNLRRRLSQGEAGRVA